MDIQPRSGESVADWRSRLDTVSVASEIEVVREVREVTLDGGQVIRFSPKSDAKPLWSVTSVGPQGIFANHRKHFSDAAADWQRWTGEALDG